METAYREVFKRLFDIVTSLLGLILLSPVFLITSILIKIDSRGPVFFRQERIGRHFKPFILYKFRSMIQASSDGPLVTTRGDKRITRVGKILRKTKIDELPQIWNVLKGEMSIVGPRPEVKEYVEIFRNEYKTILDVKPGITDYATLEYRDEERLLKIYDDPDDGYIKEILPKKIKMYRKYINEMSIFTDLKIIFLTIIKIVRP